MATFLRHCQMSRPPVCPFEVRIITVSPVRGNFYDALSPAGTILKSKIYGMAILPDRRGGNYFFSKAGGPPMLPALPS